MAVRTNICMCVGRDSGNGVISLAKWKATSNEKGEIFIEMQTNGMEEFV